MMNNNENKNITEWTLVVDTRTGLIVKKYKETK